MLRCLNGSTTRQTSNTGEHKMKKVLFASALAAVLGLTVPAYADTSEADCRAMFAKIDVGNTGWIEGAEAKPYLEALAKAGMKSADANEDGKLNADEFLAACMKDTFKGMAE
jgi:Ca2+-binding EF-hand superfamily protein